MSDCPLVRLAQNSKILKKLESAGMVAIPVTEWLCFFEALAFLNREGGQRFLYCAIHKGHLFFSKTPFERKADLPVQQHLFDE